MRLLHAVHHFLLRRGAGSEIHALRFCQVLARLAAGPFTVNMLVDDPRERTARYERVLGRVHAAPMSRT